MDARQEVLDLKTVLWFQHQHPQLLLQQAAHRFFPRAFPGGQFHLRSWELGPSLHLGPLLLPHFELRFVD